LEAIESLIQLPIRVWLGDRTVGWWANDGNFFLREGSMAKCVFAVSLFKHGFVADCQCCHESDDWCRDDGGEAVCFGPRDGFLITEYDNARFSMDGIALTICLNCENCHGRNMPWSQ
jgi:hypothetical protein